MHVFSVRIVDRVSLLGVKTPTLGLWLGMDQEGIPQIWLSDRPGSVNLQDWLTS